LKFQLIYLGRSQNRHVSTVVLPSDLQSLNEKYVLIAVQVATCRCVLTILRSAALFPAAKSVLCVCFDYVARYWEMKNGQGEEHYVHCHIMYTAALCTLPHYIHCHIMYTAALYTAALCTLPHYVHCHSMYTATLCTLLHYVHCRTMYTAALCTLPHREGKKWRSLHYKFGNGWD
jgi:hypothetical protein